MHTLSQKQTLPLFTHFIGFVKRPENRETKITVVYPQQWSRLLPYVCYRAQLITTLMTIAQSTVADTI